jgi:hypothetical protein
VKDFSKKLPTSNGRTKIALFNLFTSKSSIG